MSNLEEAKESLEKASQLDTILNPQPKGKRIKLPLARDMNMIQTILNEKLKGKEESIKEELLAQAKQRWDASINQIHTKAVQLRQEIDSLAKLVKIESKEAIKLDINSYNGYWDDLPETLQKAQEGEVLEINEDSMTSIVTIKKEIDEHVLDIKLGLSPISDVKILLQKIANIK